MKKSARKHLSKEAAWEKTASWDDVRDKGRAILTYGGVEIYRDDSQEVGAYVMSGVVEGLFPVTDGGPYEVILSKKSWENSDNVGGWLQGWLCDCIWGSYHSGTPGHGGRFSGRLCSHSYAALLAANMRARGDFMGDRTAAVGGEWNSDNFYMATEAVWEPCDEPQGSPDYSSPSGSDYWYSTAGVVRGSDHWGYGVASCNWFMDGDGIESSFADDNGYRCGFCPWGGFAPNPDVDTSVTVYDGQLAAKLLESGIRGVDAFEAYGYDHPCVTVQPTPDMMSGGYIDLLGVKVKLDPNYFMRIEKAAALDINKDNFYEGTRAVWYECNEPSRKPDFVSGSGSVYWHYPEGVVRGADHWGKDIGDCDWRIYGDIDHISAWFDSHGYRFAFCPWQMFEPNAAVSDTKWRTVALDYEGNSDQLIYECFKDDGDVKYRVHVDYLGETGCRYVVIYDGEVVFEGKCGDEGDGMALCDEIYGQVFDGVPYGKEWVFSVAKRKTAWHDSFDVGITETDYLDGWTGEANDDGTWFLYQDGEMMDWGGAADMASAQKACDKAHEEEFMGQLSIKGGKTAAYSQDELLEAKDRAVLEILKWCKNNNVFPGSDIRDTEIMMDYAYNNIHIWSGYGERTDKFIVGEAIDDAIKQYQQYGFDNIGASRKTASPYIYVGHGTDGYTLEVMDDTTYMHTDKVIISESDLPHGVGFGDSFDVSEDVLREYGVELDGTEPDPLALVDILRYECDWREGGRKTADYPDEDDCEFSSGWTNPQDGAWYCSFYIDSFGNRGAWAEVFETDAGDFHWTLHALTNTSGRSGDFDSAVADVESAAVDAAQLGTLRFSSRKTAGEWRRFDLSNGIDYECEYDDDYMGYITVYDMGAGGAKWRLERWESDYDSTTVLSGSVPPGESDAVAEEAQVACDEAAADMFEFDWRPATRKTASEWIDRGDMLVRQYGDGWWGYAYHDGGWELMNDDGIPGDEGSAWDEWEAANACDMAALDFGVNVGGVAVMLSSRKTAYAPASYDENSTWSCSEPGYEGEYDLDGMKAIYESDVDKDEYPEFNDWEWDVVRSGIMSRTAALDGYWVEDGPECMVREYGYDMSGMVLFLGNDDIQYCWNLYQRSTMYEFASGFCDSFEDGMALCDEAAQKEVDGTPLGYDGVDFFDSLAEERMLDMGYPIIGGRKVTSRKMAMRDCVTWRPMEFDTYSDYGWWYGEAENGDECAVGIDYNSNDLELECYYDGILINSIPAEFDSDGIEIQNLDKAKELVNVYAFEQIEGVHFERDYWGMPIVGSRKMAVDYDWRYDVDGYYQLLQDTDVNSSSWTQVDGSYLIRVDDTIVAVDNFDGSWQVNGYDEGSYDNIFGGEYSPDFSTPQEAVDWANEHISWIGDNSLPRIAKAAGRRLEFEDDIVIVRNPDGGEDYRGEFDYCPYKDDFDSGDWRFNGELYEDQDHPGYTLEVVASRKTAQEYDFDVYNTLDGWDGWAEVYENADGVWGWEVSRYDDDSKTTGTYVDSEFAFDTPDEAMDDLLGDKYIEAGKTAGVGGFDIELSLDDDTWCLSLPDGRRTFKSVNPDFIGRDSTSLAQWVSVESPFYNDKDAREFADALEFEMRQMVGCKTAQVTSDDNFAVGDVFEYWGNVVEVIDVDGDQILVDLVDGSDPDYPMWADSSEMADAIGLTALHKTASIKSATRQFTYAEQKELEDEIEGRELHNADRFKDGGAAYLGSL